MQGIHNVHARNTPPHKAIIIDTPSNHIPASFTHEKERPQIHSLCPFCRRRITFRTGINAACINLKGKRLTKIRSTEYRGIKQEGCTALKGGITPSRPHKLHQGTDQGSQWGYNSREVPTEPSVVTSHSEKSAQLPPSGRHWERCYGCNLGLQGTHLASSQPVYPNRLPSPSLTHISASSGSGTRQPVSETRFLASPHEQPTLSSAPPHHPNTQYS